MCACDGIVNWFKLDYMTADVEDMIMRACIAYGRWKILSENLDGRSHE